MVDMVHHINDNGKHWQAINLCIRTPPDSLAPVSLSLSLSLLPSPLLSRPLRSAPLLSSPDNNDKLIIIDNNDNN